MAFARIPFTLRQLLLAACLLGMSGLTIVVVTVLQDRLKAHLLADLAANGRALVERLAADSRLALEQGAAENLKMTLQTVASYPGVTGVLVVSNTGRTLAVNGSVPTEYPNFRGVVAPEKSGYTAFEDRLVAFAPVVSLPSETLADSPYRDRWVGSPDAHRGETDTSTMTLGYVLLNLSLRKLQADSAAINRYILIVMASGSLAVTVGLLWLLELLTRPIKNLARAMADPETAKTFCPVAIRGVKEAQTIGSAFNDLIGALARYSRELSGSKAEIERQNARLSQTVSEQIAELTARNAQLESARRQAEDASRAKSQFIAAVSHETRTPLHSLMGHLTLLGNTSLTDHQDLLRATMQEEADRLLHELNAILDFTKLEVNLFELKKRPYPPKTLIERTVRQFLPRARAKGLQLTAKTDPALPGWVLADDEQIGRILGILLDNAIKFTARGRIDVSAAFEPTDAENGLLRFRVRDTGIGISEGDGAKIFEPFTQADSSTTRRYEGTGLGLAILGQLVGLMGGRKSFESVPGKGSTFYVELPLPVSGPAAEPISEPPAPQDSALQRLVAPKDEAVSERRLEPFQAPAGVRVLVVDNERNARQYAQLILRELNLDATTAASGAEAVALCERQRFDLILMDIRMPDMDGFEATRLIRQQRGGLCARTPIVGMTADAINLDPQEWEAAGLNACRIKPLSAEVLAELLRRWNGGPAAKRLSLSSFLRRYYER